MKASTRLEGRSRDFLGRPYQINPLIGSADTPEMFVEGTDAFDCVTYVETVLAQAHARNQRDFLDRLRRVRYRNGKVSWTARNHYMTDWIRNNLRAGFVRPVSLEPTIKKDRVLDAVPGLPPRRQQFTCTPKRRLGSSTAKIQTGDLIFFASTRPQLDVFHCGILVQKDNRLMLRHASRSQGGVVEQNLSDFLKTNRMAGVIVVRPVGEDR